MARYSCLIFGVLFAVLFLLVLVTCRFTGLPLASDTGQPPPQSILQPDDD